MDLPPRGLLVCPGAHGGRLNHGYFYRQVWQPAMKAAKLQLRIHDLRHAYASLLLAFGETVLYASRQLGHSSAKLTLDTYGHLVEEGRRLDRDAT
jgi:integrase